MKLSFDRIRLIRQLESGALVSAYLHIASTAKGEAGHKYHKTKDGRIIAQFPLGAQQRLTLWVGISHGKPFAAFDFKPAHLDPGEQENLRWFFEFAPEMGGGCWWSCTTISYLEVAADIPAVDVKSVLPFSTGQAKRSMWYPDPSDPTPTQYLGSRGSAWQLRAYNRKGVPGSEPLSQLRIEVSLRKIKKRPCELTLLANPFQSVGVAVMAPWDEAPDDMIEFLEACRLQGSAVALAATGKKRSKYLAALKQLNAAWWKPLDLWTQLPDAVSALEKVLPGGCPPTMVPDTPPPIEAVLAATKDLSPVF